MRCSPKRARQRRAGASRFCMGAAWREPKDRDLDKVCEMVAGVKALGLETCATLGMLTAAQARRLKAAGLDYYNHNLDTSPEYYGADHHHPHLSGPARHPRPCARGRHARLLRRHRRHGRDARGSRRHGCGARQLAGASRKRADQSAGPGRRHAAGAWSDDRSDRLRAHDRGRAHRHAAVRGAPLRRPRGHERGNAGAVLSRRCQLDLLRRRSC